LLTVKVTGFGNLYYSLDYNYHQKKHQFLPEAVVRKRALLCVSLTSSNFSMVPNAKCWWCICKQRCYKTQHYTATHCIILQHCSIPQDICSMQRIDGTSARWGAAIYHYTLGHTATYCNTLKHIATYCNTLSQRKDFMAHLQAEHLQDATHCNTVQHTATHCSTLQLYLCVRVFVLCVCTCVCARARHRETTLCGCNVFYCVAVGTICSSVLRHRETTLYGSHWPVKQDDCSVLQCVAVCSGVLRCVAVCCSVLQCVAVCCSVFEGF